jgi:hypothetical protein
MQYEPALDAISADLAANVDLFCEEQAKLAADPWFHEPRTEGDAGPLLNVWLGWEPPGPKMPADSPLQVPPALEGKLDWDVLLASDFDFSTLDFGWMRQLQAFDRWDMLRNTPVPPPEPYFYMTATVPNYLPLQLWTKLRLVHGIRTGQPLEAARDVRHLAWLAYRSDTILGAMIATGILSIERKAHDSMQSPPLAWRPMSAEQTERMKAVFWASMPFSSIVSPVEVARKTRDCGPAIARCMGLVEAVGMARYLQPFAEGTYRPAYAALGEAVASEPCPTSLVKTLWERGGTIKDTPPAGSEMPALPAWSRGLPGTLTGRHVAGILLAMSIQDIGRLKKLRAPPDAPATADSAP